MAQIILFHQFRSLKHNKKTAHYYKEILFNSLVQLLLSEKIKTNNIFKMIKLITRISNSLLRRVDFNKTRNFKQESKTW